MADVNARHFVFYQDTHAAIPTDQPTNIMPVEVTKELFDSSVGFNGARVVNTSNINLFVALDDHRRRRYRLGPGDTFVLDPIENIFYRLLIVEPDAAQLPANEVKITYERVILEKTQTRTI